MFHLPKTQRRFFIGYVSFFLCALLMFAPLLSFTMVELERNAQRTNEEVLSGGLARLEDEILRILTAGSTLFRQQRIVALSYMDPVVTMKNAYPVSQAITFYSNVVGLLEMAEYTGLALKNGLVLADGRLHLQPSDFYPEFLSDGQSADLSTWIARLSRGDAGYSFTAMTVTTKQGVRDVVAVTMALPYNTAWGKTTFFVLLSKARILSLLALPETLALSGLTLTGPDGAALIEHRPDAIGDTVPILKTSTSFGFQAELRMDRALFSARLIAVRDLLLAAGGVYLFVGVLLSVFFAWRNAKPVLGVMEAAKAVGQEAGGRLDTLPSADGVNDYVYLRDFLQEVGARLRDNRLALVAQEQALRENMLERLLRGEVYSNETFEIARRYLPGFPERWRMALIRLLDVQPLNADEYSKMQLGLIDIARLRLQEPGALVHFSGNIMALLLPVSLPDDRQHAQDLLFALAADVRVQTGVHTYIAVSAQCSGLEALSEAFRTLRLILRTLGEDAHGRPHFAEDRLEADRTLSARNTNRFYEMLVRGEGDLAAALLAQDLDALKASTLPRETDVQQTFYLYRHALERAAIELSPSIPLILPEYSAQRSLVELFAPFRACVHQLCSAMESLRMDAGKELERAVLSLIDQNLANPDLYIKLVTDSLHISEPQLQRVMRKATGKSFFEYVDCSRMSLARELLLNTALPIREVMTRCGYSAANSFYKAFKRSYNVSPTGLRETRGG